MAEEKKALIKRILLQRGPLTAAQIARESKIDSIMCSVFLSDLCSAKEVKVTSFRVGSGPLYYLNNQEEKLLDFIDKLNEKEQKAVLYLKEKIVVKDSELTPLLRVCFKELKDFAKPLDVIHNGVKETYWKFYLASQQQVEEIIIGKPKQVEEQLQKSQKQEDISQIKKAEQIEKPKQVDIPKEHRPRQIVHPKETKKADTEVQKTINLEEEKTKKESKEAAHKIESEFDEKIKKFFSDNGIIIKEEKIIKKSEIDYVILIPSAVGNLTYYCRAKDKKTINEGDISNVFVNGQLKKLPCLLITNGEITKKAREMLEKELIGVAVKTIS